MKSIISIFFLAYSGVCVAQNTGNSTNVENDKKVNSENSVTESNKEALETGDSIKNKVTELETLVVKGKNAWVENGKIVFKPETRAKNISRDMESLIDNMNTGILHVENNRIVTSSGAEVSLFINGIPVDNMDKSTFWPKNAIRVEYILTSQDPTFMGRTNVVNFITKEYVAGGLTRLDGHQTFPNEGSYEISSKLGYKKMTYNAVVNTGYARDHFKSRERKENYNDVWYDGTHYDVINREERSEETYRDNNFYSGINARYRSDKWVITHSAAVQWSESPGSGISGIVETSPKIIDGSSMSSTDSHRSLSPSLTGNYNYIFNDKWYLATGWKLNHSHNNNTSIYCEGDAEPILTNVKENVWGGTVAISPTFIVSPSMFMQFFFRQKIDDYDMNYTGSVGSEQHQRVYETMTSYTFSYSPIRKLTIQVVPELSVYVRDINTGIKRTEYIPSVKGGIYYTVNNKSNLNLSWTYIQFPQGVSQYNDLILRQTELKWLEGNPDLKSGGRYAMGLSYRYLPKNWMTLTVDGHYYRTSNQSAITYFSGGRNYDGVIGKYSNGVNIHGIRLNSSLNFRPLQGKIQTGVELNFHRDIATHINNMSWLKQSYFIRWNFGNCTLGTTVWSADKWMEEAGMQIKKKPWTNSTYFNYGNGNLIIGIYLNNVFNKRIREDIYHIGSSYNYTEHLQKLGRSIDVRLTYTFDYGKKVEPGIDISTQDLMNTSVLGSDKK